MSEFRSNVSFFIFPTLAPRDTVAGTVYVS